MMTENIDDRRWSKRCSPKEGQALKKCFHYSHVGYLDPNCSYNCSYGSCRVTLNLNSI